jgi:hypothetical protein
LRDAEHGPVVAAGGRPSPVSAVDINPLILTPDGPVAVDALLVVSSEVTT